MLDGVEDTRHDRVGELRVNYDTMRTAMACDAIPVRFPQNGRQAIVPKDRSRLFDLAMHDGLNGNCAFAGWIDERCIESGFFGIALARVKVSCSVAGHRVWTCTIAGYRLRLERRPEIPSARRRGRTRRLPITVAGCTREFQQIFEQGTNHVGFAHTEHHGSTGCPAPASMVRRRCRT